jgi:hypothetical protein
MAPDSKVMRPNFTLNLSPGAHKEIKITYVNITINGAVYDQVFFGFDIAIDYGGTVNGGFLLFHNAINFHGVDFRINLTKYS